MLFGFSGFYRQVRINVLIDGKLHFFCGKGQTQTDLQAIGSITIDIEEPSLSVISLPAKLEKSLKVLGELYGVLCVCAIHGGKLRVWKRDEAGEKWRLFLDQACPDANSWDCISVALDTIVLTKESCVCLYKFDTGFHQCNIPGCRDVFSYPQSLFLSREEGCCDQVSTV
ncbi:unnamed protein product [Microthlaspi erraticum]|uniref:F-box associated domain-containing protein n=1 Tax=Microthlaspi erraticum TaxID=1685480 RepID=A0A6D2L9W1_9BRAS|nr:unnamed protein product [Microthlaspi erraticum]